MGSFSVIPLCGVSSNHFQTPPLPFLSYCPSFSLVQTQFSVQSSSLSRCQITLRDAQEMVRTLEETVARQTDELHAGEMERRKLHNAIQELKASLPNYTF